MISDQQCSRCVSIIIYWEVSYPVFFFRILLYTNNSNICIMHIFRNYNYIHNGKHAHWRDIFSMDNTWMVICTISFNASIILINDVGVWYFQWSCELCKKSFECRSRLERHRNAVHLQVRHACELCGRTYSRKDQVTTHWKKDHQNLTKGFTRDFMESHQGSVWSVTIKHQQ